MADASDAAPASAPVASLMTDEEKAAIVSAVRAEIQGAAVDCVEQPELYTIPDAVNRFT